MLEDVEPFVDDLCDLDYCPEPVRKHRRTIIQPDTITLSRKELLCISSADFQAHIDSFTQDLTPEQRKELSRQKRLIRNRETAAESRKRQKDAYSILLKRVDNLEARIKALEN